MAMRAHKLKCWPKYFSAVEDERKPFELRKADRDFKVGDYLCLLEFDPDKDALTGRYLYRRVSYLLDASDAPRGLVSGFVVLGLETCDSSDIERLRGQYKGALMQTVEWLQPTPMKAPDDGQ